MKSNALPLLFLIFFGVICFTPVDAQNMGGLDQGQSAPSEAKPSEISSGYIRGDVNLFNGQYTQSYSLGSVGTPSGLKYDLSLNYGTTSVQGDNGPTTTGIPYGEGWDISIPSISVSSMQKYKYDHANWCNNDAQLLDINGQVTNSRSFSLDELNHEGDLYWFQPYLNIPGVASGRLVYKYNDYDLSINQARYVFVLHNFETYVEAKFDGSNWEVWLPDGTVYHMNVPKVNIIAPNNQRIPDAKAGDAGQDCSLSASVQRPSSVAASITPREEMVSWLVGSITRPNSPSPEKIVFTYNRYGKFDFYQEYKQNFFDQVSRWYFYSDVPDDLPNFLGEQHPTLLGGPDSEHRNWRWDYCYSQGNCNTQYKRLYPTPDFSAYRDIILKSVRSEADKVVIDRIDLNYRHIDPSTLTDPGNQLYHPIKKDELPSPDLNFGNYDADAGVFDSMYHYVSVYKANTWANHGTANSEYKSNCTDWSRYRHGMSSSVFDALKTSASYHAALSAIPISSSNPYKIHLAADYYYYRESTADEASQALDPSFDHSFLESPRIGGNIDKQNSRFKSGDIYEVRTVIGKDPQAVVPLSEAFLNLDINIASGFILNDQRCNTNNTADPVPANFICDKEADGTRDFTVFSTFSRPVKWTYWDGIQELHDKYDNLDHYRSSVITSNFFQMPYLPPVYNGFNIQVGPGNSDMNYALPRYDATSGSGSVNLGTSNFPCAYKAYWDYSGGPNGHLPFNDFNSSVSPNFGLGYPWFMMRSLYSHDGGFTWNDDDSCSLFSGGDGTGLSNRGHPAYGRWFNVPNINASNPVWPGYSGSGTNDPTLAGNYFKLEDVELIRYFKTTYMLDNVVIYKTNGNCDVTATTGESSLMNPIRKFKLSYDVRETKAYTLCPPNNTVNDELTTCAGGLPYSMKRNVIVLSDIDEVPLGSNGQEIANTTVADYISDHFDYTVMDINGTTGWNITSIINPTLSIMLSIIHKDLVLLSKVTNNLGAVKEITYSPLSTANIIAKSNYTPGSLCTHSTIPMDNHQEYYKRTNSPSVFEITPTVATVTLHGGPETDQNGNVVYPHAKIWSYEFLSSNAIQNNTALGLGESRYNIFSTKNYDHIEVGYTTVKVYEPPLDTNNALARAYTEYHYDHDPTHPVGASYSNRSSDYHTFGKLLETDYYNPAGELIEKNQSSYLSKLAYKSGLYRTVTPGDMTYLHRYADLSSTAIQDNSTLIMQNASMAKGANSYVISGNQKLFELGLDHTSDNLVSSDHLLNSYFVFKTQDIKTIYEHEASGSPRALVYHTEYAYWDADATGSTTCAGNAMLNNTASTSTIPFEPSWQIYSVKKYCDQSPGVSSKEEHFYYFDVANGINGPDNQTQAYNFRYLTGPFIGRENNLRNLEYQIRTKTTSSANTTETISKSKYFFYDAQWSTPEDDIPTTAVDMPYDFGPCSGKPAIVIGPFPGILNPFHIIHAIHPSPGSVDYENIKANPFALGYPSICGSCTTYQGENVDFGTSFVYRDKIDHQWYKCPKATVIPYKRGDFFSSSGRLAALVKTKWQEDQDLNVSHPINRVYFINMMNSLYGVNGTLDKAFVGSLYQNMAQMQDYYNSIDSLQADTLSHDSELEAIVADLKDLEDGTNSLIASFNKGNTLTGWSLPVFKDNLKQYLSQRTYIPESTFDRYLASQYRGARDSITPVDTAALMSSLYTHYSAYRNAFLAQDTFADDTSLQNAQTQEEYLYNIATDRYNKLFKTNIPYLKDFLFAYYTDLDQHTVEQADMNYFFTRYGLKGSPLEYYKILNGLLNIDSKRKIVANIHCVKDSFTNIQLQLMRKIEQGLINRYQTVYAKDSGSRPAAVEPLATIYSKYLLNNPIRPAYTQSDLFSYLSSNFKLDIDSSGQVDTLALYNVADALDSAITADANVRKMQSTSLASTSAYQTALATSLYSKRKLYFSVKNYEAANHIKFDRSEPTRALEIGNSISGDAAFHGGQVDYAVFENIANQEHPGPGDPPQLPLWPFLGDRIYLKSIATQVDDQPMAYNSSDPSLTANQDNLLLRFEYNDEQGNIDDHITTSRMTVPVYPYLVLMDKLIMERNHFMQVLLEKDALNLYTKYRYEQGLVVHEYDRNPSHWCIVNNHTVIPSRDCTYFKNIGLPIAMTVGWGRPDAQVHTFDYINSGAVKRITDPNGIALTYAYDGFDRLQKSFKNGNLIGQYGYAMWDKNAASEFNDRRGQSYVSTAAFTDLTSQALVSRKYVDAFGRAYGTTSQVVNDINALTPSPNIYVTSGEKVYDAWDRIVSEYRPFLMPGNQTTIKPQDNSLLSAAAPQSIQQSFYQNDKRNRVTQQVPFGQSSTGGHTNQFGYVCVNGSTLVSDLSLTTPQINQMMQFSHIFDYWYLKSTSTDPDGRVTETYTDVNGRKVAERVDPTGLSLITLYMYDAQGNVSRTYDPEGFQSSYKYNLLGQLYEEWTPDKGTVRRKYNQRGQVAIEYDSTMAPYPHRQFRQYQYDVFGHLVAQGMSSVNTSATPPISNSALLPPHPALDDTYDPFGTSVTYDNLATNAQDGVRKIGNYTKSLSWLTEWGIQNTPMGYPYGTKTFLFDWVDRIVPGHYATYASVGDGADRRVALEPVLTNGLYITNKMEKAFVYNTCNAPWEGAVSTADGQNSQPPVEILDPAYTSGYFGQLSTALDPVITSSISGAASRSKGKLVLSTAFDNNGIAREHVSTTYNSDGLVSEQYHQFDATHTMNAALPAYLLYGIYYPKYNLQGSLLQKKVRVLDYSFGGHSLPTSGPEYTYQYDSRNRLSTVAFNPGNSSAVNLVGYSYDDVFNRISSTRYVNGTVLLDQVNTDYDVRDRLTSLSGGLFSETLSYDGATRNNTSITQANYNGNINQVAALYKLGVMDNYNNGVSSFFPDHATHYYNYEYDAANRLKIADAYALNATTGDESYSYMKNGNFMTRVRDGITVNYDYYSGGNKLYHYGLRTFGYDNNGNMSSDINGPNSLSHVDYGRANLPVTLSLSTGNVNYLYGVDDNRMYRTHNLSSGNVQEHYIKDATGTTLAVYDQIHHIYEWNINGADLLATYSGGQYHYHTYDHLGNTRVSYYPILSYGGSGEPYYDNHGGLVLGPPNALSSLHADAVHEYRPFGSMLYEFISHQDRYLTTHHERDNSETGYDYRGARFYDAEVGRFLSLDPKAMKYSAWAPYVYTLNNPIAFIDPDGKDVHLVIGNQPIGMAEIRICQPSNQEGAPKTMMVALYKLTVTDDATKKVTSYTVTRDAPVLDRDPNNGISTPAGTLYNVVNTSFEPVGNDEYNLVPTVVAGEGAYALRSTSGSEKLPAEPNVGYFRKDPAIATGVQIHIGGTFQNSAGENRIAGSEGCFTLNGKDAGNNGIRGLVNDINRRIQANRKAHTGTDINLKIKKRQNVPQNWIVPGQQ